MTLPRSMPVVWCIYKQTSRTLRGASLASCLWRGIYTSRHPGHLEVSHSPHVCVVVYIQVDTQDTWRCLVRSMPVVWCTYKQTLRTLRGVSFTSCLWYNVYTSRHLGHLEASHSLHVCVVVYIQVETQNTQRCLTRPMSMVLFGHNETPSKPEDISFAQCLSGIRTQ